MSDIEAEQITPLKAALFGSLARRLTSEGFQLNTPDDNFVRCRDGITDIFQVTCLNAKPGYRVQPGVAVRIERVEEIFHQTSGFEPKYQHSTPTMGTRVGAYWVVVPARVSSGCSQRRKYPRSRNGSG